MKIDLKDYIVVYSDGCRDTEFGLMERLDKFAGLAMQAITSAMTSEVHRKAIRNGAKDVGESPPEFICGMAYEHALCMLAERKRLLGGGDA